MDAVVTERIYPGLGHTINEDEIARVGKPLTQLAQRGGQLEAYQ
jgi:hypothetical protein